eukprot:m.209738 g.209738  ORF g.209738 m.209738 type:complete len:258 (+) comp18996_c0_seq1:329-1102(+)
MALNATEVDAVTTLAKEKDVFVLEAYHYRYHPVAQRLQALLEEAPLGPIQSASISFSLVDVKAWWSQTWHAAMRSVYIYDCNQTEENVFATHKMLDRWCYCADMAVLVAHSTGLTFDSVSTAHVSSTRVAATLEYFARPGDDELMQHYKSVPVTLLATKSTLEFPHWNVVVSCAHGDITVSNIGFPFLGHSISLGNSTEHHYGHGGTTYEYQLEYFVANIRKQVIHAHDSRSTANLIDKINQAANVPRSSTVSWIPS